VGKTSPETKKPVASWPSEEQPIAQRQKIAQIAIKFEKMMDTANGIVKFKN
jgi:hypothetical protein